MGLYRRAPCAGEERTCEPLPAPCHPPGLSIDSISGVVTWDNLGLTEGFKSNWQRLMRKCMGRGVIAERFQFRDLRAKTGSDSEDDNLLGHEDPRTLHRHYKRKPTKVTPLRSKILDNR